MLKVSALRSSFIEATSKDVMKLRLNTGFEGAAHFVILRLLSTLRSRPAIV